MSTLTSKYQATIPRQVREALGLGKGDRVEFVVRKGGDVRVRKVVDVEREMLKAVDEAFSPEWLSKADEEAWRDL